MTLIKDAGKNSDGYEAKVKETASLQGRFFVGMLGMSIS